MYRDLTSTQNKVLKCIVFDCPDSDMFQVPLFCENIHTYFDDRVPKRKRLSQREITIALEDLESFGLIKAVSKNPKYGSPEYLLTSEGRSYYEVKKKDKSRFLKQSIATPIIVSAITSLLTLGIVELLSVLIQHLKQ